MNKYSIIIKCPELGLESGPHLVQAKTEGNAKSKAMLKADDLSVLRGETVFYEVLRQGFVR